MGQVYQATDTKLNRQVALKILPEAFATDPDRLARFQREAQVLASLNHPGIAAIHGLEDSEGTKALVLELVEGPTLADRITQGPIPVDEALPIAKQIAEALEAAHEAGVIHRDLKPANIKVREDGTVKVLDFGLAKALDIAPEGDPSQSPTLTAAATQMGVIMGTAAYMSPEQARGKPVDRRADIWAFGAVLFEMLTGTKPFPGDDVTQTLARVVEREPDWNVLPSDLSPVLATYLRRCLAKEPKQRVPDIAAMRLAMEGAFETTGQKGGESSAAQSRWRPTLPWAVAGVMAVIAGAAIGTGPDSADRLPLRFPLELPTGFHSVQLAPKLALAPDGNTLVYGGPDQLYRRDFGQLAVQPGPGTEGALEPFFSPDGQWVGFTGRNRLFRKVSLAGWPSTPLADARVRGASWGQDETILFGVQDAGLSRVSAAGGEPDAITALAEGEISHVYPDILPSGDAALFTIWTGSLETSQVAVVSLDTGVYQPLVGGTYPRYASTGHLVFAREASLWAVPFDAERLEVMGSPVPVLEGVEVSSLSGAAQFTLSDNGSLVYIGGDVTSTLRTLAWVGRDGTEEAVAAEPRPYEYLRLSHDGQRVVVDEANRGGDIWVWNFTSDNAVRLTMTDEAGMYPV